MAWVLSKDHRAERVQDHYKLGQVGMALVYQINTSHRSCLGLHLHPFYLLSQVICALSCDWMNQKRLLSSPM